MRKIAFDMNKLENPSNIGMVMYFDIRKKVYWGFDLNFLCFEVVCFSMCVGGRHRTGPDFKSN